MRRCCSSNAARQTSRSSRHWYGCFWRPDKCPRLRATAGRYKYATQAVACADVAIAVELQIQLVEDGVHQLPWRLPEYPVGRFEPLALADALEGQDRTVGIARTPNCVNMCKSFWRPHPCPKHWFYGVLCLLFRLNAILSPARLPFHRKGVRASSLSELAFANCFMQMGDIFHSPAPPSRAGGKAERPMFARTKLQPVCETVTSGVAAGRSGR